jgi:hypothetical protein
MDGIRGKQVLLRVFLTTPAEEMFCFSIFRIGLLVAPLRLNGIGTIPYILRGRGLPALAIEDAAEGFAVGAVAAGEEALLGLHGGDLLGGSDDEELIDASPVAIAYGLKSRFERHRQTQREGGDFGGHGLILLRSEIEIEAISDMEFVPLLNAAIIQAGALDI